MQHIKVYTNDPAHQEIILQVSGNVKNFVSIYEKRVRFHGTVNDNLKEKVIIIPEKELFFTILKAYAEDGQNIKFSIDDAKIDKDNNVQTLRKTIVTNPATKEDKIGYSLNIENISKKPSVYRDTIVLETDSPIKNKIKIRVYGQITEQ